MTTPNLTQEQQEKLALLERRIAELEGNPSFLVKKVRESYIEQRQRLLEEATQ